MENGKHGIHPKTGQTWSCRHEGFSPDLSSVIRIKDIIEIW